jgi:putative transposase
MSRMITAGVTDKLKSYRKPINMKCRQTEHRSYKGLNNRVENAHQPTRRKEKCLIKFKSIQGVQKTLSLMGKARNIFAVDVGGYIKNAAERRMAFAAACGIWSEAAQKILCV